MNKRSHFIALFVILIVPWSASAGSADSTSPLKSSAQSAERAWALGVFFQGAVLPVQNTEEIFTAAPKIGNALLQNLPVLFALNALFSGASNGLLSPGPASLANIIILYQIFFAPNVPVFPNTGANGDMHIYFPQDKRK